MAEAAASAARRVQDIDVRLLSNSLTGQISAYGIQGGNVSQLPIGEEGTFTTGGGTVTGEKDDLFKALQQGGAGL